MESLQHSVGGHPPVPSFKDVLVSQATHSPQASFPNDPLPDKHRTGSHKGLPAIFFKSAHIDHITSPYQWALIGKFSQGYNKQNPSLGRPPVEELEKYFQTLDLKRDVQLGLLDNRHVLIQIRHHEDFLHLYSRPIWHIKGIPMRIFKWTSTFHVDRESPLAPVWVSFPRLPVHFFDKDTMMSIASLIGSPLRLDASTLTLKRPSIARVQIEIDLLQSRVEKIWIGVEDGDGFWQKLEYENVPDYCHHCWHVGHSDSLCYVHNPELKGSHPRPVKMIKQQYVPIPRDKSVAPHPATGSALPADSLLPLVQASDPSGSKIHPPNAASELDPTAHTTVTSAFEDQVPLTHVLQINVTPALHSANVPVLPSADSALPSFDASTDHTVSSDHLTPPVELMQPLAPMVLDAPMEKKHQSVVAEISPTTKATIFSGFQTTFTTPVVEDLEADLSSDEDAALIINEFRPLAESSIGRSVSLSDLSLVDCRATPEVVITTSETAVQDLPIISKEVGFTQQVVKELYCEEHTDANDVLATAQTSVPPLNKLKRVPGISNFSAGHRSLIETSQDDILDDLRNSSQQLNKIFAERSLAQHSTIKAKSPLVDQPELEVDDSMNLTEIAVLVDEDDFIPVQKKKRGRPRKTVKN